MGSYGLPLTMVLLPATVPLSVGKPATGLTAVALVLVRYSAIKFCRTLGSLNLETHTRS